MVTAVSWPDHCMCIGIENVFLLFYIPNLLVDAKKCAYVRAKLLWVGSRFCCLGKGCSYA